MTDAYLYVIGLPSGPKKVGLSQNLTRRLAAIRASAGPAELLHSEVVQLSDGKLIEGRTHWLLRRHAVGGEWFNVDLSDAVQAIGGP